MREIKCEDITKTVKQLCMEAACNLPSDVFKALKDKTDTEPYPLAKKTLEVLIDNADLAKDNMMPICPHCREKIDLEKLANGVWIRKVEK